MKVDAGRRASASLIEPSCILNPNKAVLTLDATGRILTENDMTTLLLGEDLHQNKATIFDFLVSSKDIDVVRGNLTSGRNSRRPERDQNVIAEEDAIQPGGLVVFSGHVVSLKTNDMGEIPVSLWIKELPMDAREEPRWVTVIEPITTLESKIRVSEGGVFVKVDRNFRLIFGCFPSAGETVFDFISAVKFPDELEIETINQSCTGHTKDFNTFPLTVSVVMETKPNDKPLNQFYSMKIKLMYNISGLVVVDECGTILQYNHNFTRLLFGYGPSELVGENIHQILPEFESSCRSAQSQNFDEIIDFNGKQSLSTDFRSNGESLLKEEMSSNVIDTDLPEILTDSSMQDSMNNGCIISSSSYTGSSNSTATDASTTPLNSGSGIPTHNPTSLNGTYTDSISRRDSAPSQPMRDITNSINLMNISDQTEKSWNSIQSNVVTSTPTVSKQSENHPGQNFIQEGSYFAEAKHKDGTVIGVLYQIRQMALNERQLFCIWVTWEQIDSSVYHSYTPDEADFEISPRTQAETLSSKNDEADPCLNFSPMVLDYSDYEPIDEYQEETSKSVCTESENEDIVGSLTTSQKYQEDAKDDTFDHLNEETEGMRRSLSENEVTNMKKKSNNKMKTSRNEDPDWVLASGEYINHHTIVKAIGKGAFGCVKLSYRNKDGLIAISKFIRKAQVYKDSWTVDPDTGEKISMEVYLLQKLEHPNIVKALAAYENEKYFQLVMEKFGCGMDLFEFIERNPTLDEPLISYIFRQIVSPLKYLRSLNIIHRDIKDENIIINEKFHIKLIDFGSATYLEPGKKFAQFAGTIEYCSPEVLKGHKYSGPELEIWSLGVTLYTLIFGENPFSTVDQVIQQPMVIPCTYSENLSILLKLMMDKDPNERMNLEEVADHPWTNLEVDIDSYNFENIVRCKPGELNPPRYISEYGLSDESFSNTSSSLVFQTKCNPNIDHSLQSSRKSIDSSFSPYGTKDGCEADVSDISVVDNTNTYSRTSTSRSSVTIDSSIFHVTPLSERRKHSGDLSGSGSDEIDIDGVNVVDSRDGRDSNDTCSNYQLLDNSEIYHSHSSTSSASSDLSRDDTSTNSETESNESSTNRS